MFMGVTSMVEPKQDGREVHISRGGLRHEQYDSSRIVNDIGLVQLMHAVDVLSSSKAHPRTRHPPSAGAREGSECGSRLFLHSFQVRLGW